MPAVLRFESGPAGSGFGSTWQGIGGLWRSLVARFVWDEDVAGSNPVSPTLLARHQSSGPGRRRALTSAEQAHRVDGSPLRPRSSANRPAALSMDRGLRLV